MKFSREAKVGLFVLVAILVLAYLTFQVEELKIFKPKGYRIKVEFDSVEGLDVKAPVRMAGVRVGEVEKIELSGTKVLVTLRLDKGVVVRRSYRVTVGSVGLLGEKYVEIYPRESWEAKAAGQVEPGQAGNEIVTEGSPPIKGESPVSMDQILKQINSVAENIKIMTDSLNAGVGQRKEKLGDIIDNFYKFSRDLNQIMTENKDSLNNAFKKTGEISENLAVITASLKEILGKPENIQQSLRNIQNATAKMDKIMDSAGRITERLEKGEGTIGKLLTEEETYENLNESLKGLKAFLGSAESLKLTVGYRGEYQFRNNNLKSYISFRLQPKEDKYFQFVIVDDPLGDLRWRERTKLFRSSTGAKVTSREFEEVRSSKVKFSAIVAKRFWDLTLRGGLVESSGGFGADYHLWKDRIRLSVDVFDFGRRGEARFGQDPVDWVNASRRSIRRAETKKIAPNIKVGAAWNINENIFIEGGVNELANRDRIGPFIAGGIIFTDEDLKWLMGRLPSLPLR